MNFQNPNTNILNDKKLFIFDMDGTIYLGNQVFDFAIEFIKNLRANGKKVLAAVFESARQAQRRRGIHDARARHADARKDSRRGHHPPRYRTG